MAGSMIIVSWKPITVDFPTISLSLRRNMSWILEHGLGPTRCFWLGAHHFTIYDLETMSVYACILYNYIRVYIYIYVYWSIPPETSWNNKTNLTSKKQLVHSHVQIRQNTKANCQQLKDGFEIASETRWLHHLTYQYGFQHKNSQGNPSTKQMLPWISSLFLVWGVLVTLIWPGVLMT